MSGVRLIIMGRQGAGKGTQCLRISRFYVVPHISTGDILRGAVREGSELGRAAKQIIESGGLVGDDIMIEVIRQRLEQDDARTRGYILDGFPRTVAQAIALDGLAADRPIQAVLDLHVPRHMVLQRISSRRVCQDCGSNYVSSGRDPSPWICDTCGGDVVQRDDDSTESVNRRLDLYETQTSPLLDYYSERGRLVEIDGTAAPDEVFRSLRTAIDSARKAG